MEGGEGTDGVEETNGRKIGVEAKWKMGTWESKWKRIKLVGEREEWKGVRRKQERGRGGVAGSGIEGRPKGVGGSQQLFACFWNFQLRLHRVLIHY